MWFLLILILVLLFITIFVDFFPQIDWIYYSKDGDLINVIDRNKLVVTIQYVEYEPISKEYVGKTNPMNIGLFEFIKEFRLWTTS